MLKQIRTIKWLFLLKGKNYIKSLNRQFPHIEPSSRLKSCHFYLNKTTELTIDSECYLRNVKIFAFSGANKIYIGKNTKISDCIIIANNGNITIGKTILYKNLKIVFKLNFK